MNEIFKINLKRTDGNDISHSSFTFLIPHFSFLI
jgi:hypothetical protein